ncbi:hypothetical protein VNO77_43944 [Canavalia gladiata]|uniref:Uncharacterized protein n=1 Tax=Canavalia gladiata TaxID=3824 RepID=A0AAN9JV16_CANGL
MLEPDLSLNISSSSLSGYWILSTTRRKASLYFCDRYWQMLPLFGNVEHRKLYNYFTLMHVGDDDETFVITKMMPKLRHLQLLGNRVVSPDSFHSTFGLDAEGHESSANFSWIEYLAFSYLEKYVFWRSV